MTNAAPLYKKWLWFNGLWLAGFLTLGIIGYSIRLVIGS
jgi:preprotein translocase subunit Sss1